jgi:predicted MFS family arabinose efflux permease
MPITIDAPPAAVLDAVAREATLTASPSDGALRGPFPPVPFEGSVLTATVTALEPGPGGRERTELRLAADTPLAVPFLGWFAHLQAWLAARGALRHLGDRVDAALDGRPAPPPPRRWPIVPPVTFTDAEAARLAALAAVAILVNFCGALLTQNGDAVTRTFDETDQALGAALAIARAGVLVSLVVVALADRWGRRRLLLVAVVGACASNLVAAAAPSFAAFTAAQLMTRAFVNAALVVAGIAVVEEAPEGARAFATAMFGLALGAGVGLSVVFLPLADLGDSGWRISFAVSALAVVFLPSIARQLRETKRFDEVAGSDVARGRVREVFRRTYGWRFLLLGLAAFLTNVFAAPSSQLTNRYLTDAHGFSNSEVAVFRAVTLGLPGLIGILIAGRLAESRGRRPVTVVGLLVATGFQMAFFLSSGALLWVTPMIAIVAAACAGLALATLDAELFPTEVRGTSNAFLLVAAVAGSATGLVLATQLRDAAGGLGPAIAWCGLATVAAALLVVPRLPETARRDLDDVSPTERPPAQE